LTSKQVSPSVDTRLGSSTRCLVSAFAVAAEHHFSITSTLGFRHEPFVSSVRAGGRLTLALGACKEEDDASRSAGPANNPTDAHGTCGCARRQFGGNSRQDCRRARGGVVGDLSNDADELRDDAKASLDEAQGTEREPGLRIRGRSTDERGDEYNIARAAVAPESKRYLTDRGIDARASRRRRLAANVRPCRDRARKPGPRTAVMSSRSSPVAINCVRRDD
jgi:hypothetical protein